MSTTSLIIGELKCYDNSVDAIRALNDAFDRVRQAAPTITDRQIAVVHMKNELETTTAAFPRLVSKSANLQSELDQWLRNIPRDEVDG